MDITTSMVLDVPIDYDGNDFHREIDGFTQSYITSSSKVCVCMVVTPMTSACDILKGDP